MFLNRHIHIVVPDWLTECIRRWEKVDERLYPLAEGAKFSESFLRDAVGGHGRRPVNPSENAPSTSSSSAADRIPTPRFGSLSCLAGLSAEIVQGMEDEIDNAFDDNDDTEEEEDTFTVNDGMQCTKLFCLRTRLIDRLIDWLVARSIDRLIVR